ncbi:GrpB family protein [Eubacterium aggregans]
MNHIGSTAVPLIWAKSIVDILVEVPITKTKTPHNTPAIAP